MTSNNFSILVFRKQHILPEQNKYPEEKKRQKNDGDPKESGAVAAVADMVV